MEEDDRKWGEGYRERKEGRKEMKENYFEDENAFLQEKSSFNARSTLLLTSLKKMKMANETDQDHPEEQQTKRKNKDARPFLPRRRGRRGAARESSHDAKCQRKKRKVRSGRSDAASALPLPPPTPKRARGNTDCPV